LDYFSIERVHFEIFQNLAIDFIGILKLEILAKFKKNILTQIVRLF